MPKYNYILVYVINGVNYDFSSSQNGITLMNDATQSVVGNTNLDNINYTSNFTGLLRFYNCSNHKVTLSFSATNQGSNIQDNQNNCGANYWVGHLYKRKDYVALPPSNVNAFSSYIGYITETEVFSELFGDDNSCFTTYSNGSNRINTFTEFFAARFCNQSVKPKGAYIISSVRADDGIRIYIDGNLIMNRWIEQSVTTYSNILFSHSGNSQIKVEYYESAGQNEIAVGTMNRVNNVLNTNLNQLLCQGNASSQINGTNTYTTAPVSSNFAYSVTYQWQVSTDNVNFTGILGATALNYTPTQTNPGTYYFRRLATINTINPGSISVSSVDESNVAILKIRPKPIGTLKGSVICEGDPTAQLTFTSDAGTGPFNLVINGVIYNNITSGVPINITAPPATTIYNLTKITDVYGCINP
ncbi:MAG: hypothetical protein IPH57_02385 [Saprospiraceae bacterium]|nr:hypothetical protein [Saprospiraceae bacterium]